jgi:hypothetical protein
VIVLPNSTWQDDVGFSTQPVSLAAPQSISSDTVSTLFVRFQILQLGVEYYPLYRGSLLAAVLTFVHEVGVRLGAIVVRLKLSLDGLTKLCWCAYGIHMFRFAAADHAERRERPNIYCHGSNNSSFARCVTPNSHARIAQGDLVDRVSTKVPRQAFLRAAFIGLALAFTLAMFSAACGGSGAGQTGTPAGTYTLTITATAGAGSQSTTMSLTVN